MLAVYGDPEVMRFIPGGAFRGIETMKARLKTYGANPSGAGSAPGRSSSGRADEVIGDAGFGLFEPTGDIELGYTLARAYWGAATRPRPPQPASPRARPSAPRGSSRSRTKKTCLAARRRADRNDEVETIEAHYRPHVLFEAGR